MSHLTISVNSFAKKKYLSWYHIPNAGKRRDSVNFFIKSGLLEKLPSNTAVSMWEERVLGSDGMTAASLLSAWMQFPNRWKLCKAGPAAAGFQMCSFVAESRQESTSAFLLKPFLRKRVPPSHCKQNWLRRVLPKNWLRVLENTLFCSVGCWVLVSESYPRPIAPMHLLQLNIGVVLSCFLVMITPNHARYWPGRMNKMHKLFLISM